MTKFVIGDRVAFVHQLDRPGTVVGVFEGFVWVKLDNRHTPVTFASIDVRKSK